MFAYALGRLGVAGPQGSRAVAELPSLALPLSPGWPPRFPASELRHRFSQGLALPVSLCERANEGPF